MQCFIFMSFVNNLNMKMFKLFNRFHSTLLIPFVISSALLVADEIINLIEDRLNGSLSELFSSLSELFSKALPFIYCYFIVLVLSKGKRGFKAFWGVLCLSVALTCTGTFGNSSLSLLLGIFLSLVYVYCFNHFDAWLSMIFTVLIAILAGILFGYISDYFDNFIMWLSGLISDKGVLSSTLFSALDSVFTLFNIDNFRETFFHKSFGGSLLFNGELITGVKDLYFAGYNGQLVSAYLSGHFYMLFTVAGMAGALAAELKSAQRITFLITAVCSVLSGNIFVFLLFVFLETPFLFLSAMLINILAYISAYVLNLEIGYIHNGSLIEMLINMNNTVYLIAGGIVFVCIGFFVTRYIVEKHGISDCLNIYIPTRLNRLVTNLGGIANIIRFKDSVLEVRNPKLVNTLELDCKIEENTVISNDELFAELQEYL